MKVLPYPLLILKPHRSSGLLKTVNFSLCTKLGKVAVQKHTDTNDMLTCSRRSRNGCIKKFLLSTGKLHKDCFLCASISDIVIVLSAPKRSIAPNNPLFCFFFFYSLCEYFFVRYFKIYIYF